MMFAIKIANSWLSHRWSPSDRRWHQGIFWSYASRKHSHETITFLSRKEAEEFILEYPWVPGMNDCIIVQVKD